MSGPDGDKEASAVVRLRHLRHDYGSNAALDGVTLDIPAGRMVGLVGPDGVGKSTLLGLIAGAKALQQGGAEVLGGDISDAGWRRSVCPRIAYMPQGLGKNLYPDLTVAENITFFSRLYGQGAEEGAARLRSLLRDTGLSPFADRLAQKLSGGMRQKLGLCCSLIHDPQLLILDEPTTGVDPLSRRQFWELVDRMRQNAGAVGAGQSDRQQMSVIVATAYMEEAERFDFLIAMNAGKVLATGTPGQIKARTGADSIEEAFVALLPEAERARARKLEIPPRSGDGDAPVISARGLTCRFGDFTAVDHVDLDIGRGEIFGFVGSNGCGKTTTMKMLCGLLPPTEGTASLFGQTMEAGGMESRRRVGYMSQSFSLYTELTVAQNLELHARLFHLSRDDARARIAELLDRFGLKAQENALASDLPLGMRQRLALAVALVHKPDLLILDEPTSGVDPIARDEFWRLLIELSREQGVTIFISTHFMNEAARCDRISLMDFRQDPRHRPARETGRGEGRRHAGRGVHRRSRTGWGRALERSGGGARRSVRRPGVAGGEKPLVQPAPHDGLHHPRNPRIVARPDPPGLCAVRPGAVAAGARLRHHHGRGFADLCRARPRQQLSQPRLCL